MKIIITVDRNYESMEEQMELDQAIREIIENETSMCVEYIRL